MTRLSDSALDHLRALDPTPGVIAERYEVHEEIGRGGMGVVYRAFDRLLGRDIALKVVGDESGASGGWRLSREAHALARLEHPGIVPVHDVGTLADGRVFYVMRLVRGERLDRRLVSGMPVGDALRAFSRICEVVAFAHSCGVIHRDLKPQNVMLGAFGEVLVLDWGVARILDDTASRHAAERQRSARDGVNTGDGTEIGTPGYMPPEQSRNASGADERADVFALGRILRDIVSAGEPRTARAALESIVARATAGDPSARYATAGALAADVSAFLDGQPIGAHREGIAERAGRLGRRHRAALTLIGVYVVVRLAMLWLLRPAN